MYTCTTVSAGNNRLTQEHSGHYSGFLDNQHDPTSDDITPIEFICDTHNVCNASYICTIKSTQSTHYVLS